MVTDEVNVYTRAKEIIKIEDKSGINLMREKKNRKQKKSNQRR
jgi:hypothetical protein